MSVGSPRRAPAEKRNYRLILFVAGEEPNSRAARENLAHLCQTDLAGRCDVEIVDVLEDFGRADEHHVLVTPTLLVLEPEPELVVIGNLSDREKVRSALRLAKREDHD